jgi:hypothetical protein
MSRSQSGSASLRRELQTWLALSVLSVPCFGLFSGIIGTVLCLLAWQAMEHGQLSDAEAKLRWGKIVTVVGFAVGLCCAVAWWVVSWTRSR